MSSITMDENISYKKILKNKKARDVFPVPATTFQAIKTYEFLFFNSEKYDTDTCTRIYIDWLKDIYKRSNDDFFYEDIVASIVKNCYSDDLMCFLLSQKFDMDYSYMDYCGKHFVLRDYLALTITSPKIMKVFLNKVENYSIKLFGDQFSKHYTDLCIMNTLAGNYDKAIEIFESNNYNLFFNDVSVSDIINDLEDEYYSYIDNFYGNDSDRLFRILSSINEEKPLEERSAFLKRILYNDKIKLFNIDNIELITRNMLEEDYEAFMKYLMIKVDSGTITTFSTLNDNNMIYKEPLNHALIKPKQKRIAS